MTLPRTATILSLALLSMAQDNSGSCDPTSLEAADVRPGDGGAWVHAGDASQFFSNNDLIDFKKRPFPSDDTLCMLIIGDLNETSDYPKWQGIWIEDVKQPWFLGPVEPGGDTRDSEGAQLRYTYCDPTSLVPGCMDTITLILRFETIVAVQQSTTKAWDQPYFLSGYTAMGADRVQMMLHTRFPTCLDWKYRETEQFHAVTCENCATLGQDFSWCNSAVTPDPRDCFRSE